MRYFELVRYFYSFSYFLFVEIEPHCIGKLVGSATFDNCELIFLKVFHALRKTCCVNVRDINFAVFTMKFSSLDSGIEDTDRFASTPSVSFRWFQFLTGDSSFLKRLKKKEKKNRILEGRKIFQSNIRNDSFKDNAVGCVNFHLNFQT